MQEHAEYLIIETVKPTNNDLPYLKYVTVTQEVLEHNNNSLDQTIIYRSQIIKNLNGRLEIINDGFIKPKDIKAPIDIAYGLNLKISDRLEKLALKTLRAL